MANENNKTKGDLTLLSNGLATSDSEYVRLVSLISDTWEKAKGRAAIAVNTELLEANWQTGRYIVEFEQHGNLCAIPKNPNGVWTINMERILQRFASTLRG